MQLQAFNVAIGNELGIAGKLLGKIQRGFFFLAEIAGFVLALLFGAANPAARGRRASIRQMMLQAVAAALIIETGCRPSRWCQFQRAANAGVNGKNVFNTSGRWAE